MHEINARFKKIRNLANKSQQDFANDLEITKQAVSNIETGKSAPSLAVLEKLLEKYNINLNYIVAGIGSIYLINNENYQEIRSSLIKEVEKIIDSCWINKF